MPVPQGLLDITNNNKATDAQLDDIIAFLSTLELDALDAESPDTDNCIILLKYLRKQLQPSRRLMLTPAIRDALITKINTLNLKINNRIEEGLTLVKDKDNTPINIENINNRAKEMALEIKNDSTIAPYPILLIHLDGAYNFSTYLRAALDAIGFKYEPHFIKPQSYRGTESVGSVKLTGFSVNVAHRDILGCDDLIESGNTALAVQKELYLREARSVRYVVLCDKPYARTSKQQPAEIAGLNKPFVGFTIENNPFLLGFGMGYDELLRTPQGVFEADSKTLPTEVELLMRELLTPLNEQVYQANLAQKNARESSITNIAQNPYMRELYKANEVSHETIANKDETSESKIGIVNSVM